MKNSRCFIASNQIKSIITKFPPKLKAKATSAAKETAKPSKLKLAKRLKQQDLCKITPAQIKPYLITEPHRILLSHSNKVLLEKSKACGLKQGTKTEMASSILSHIKTSLLFMDKIEHIICIDIGLKNLAFTRINVKGYAIHIACNSRPRARVIELARLSPAFPISPYDPISFAIEAQAVVKRHFVANIGDAGKTVVLVERQTSTSSSWGGTPLAIQRCLILESLFVSAFVSLSVSVQSIFPRTVATYFNIGGFGSTRSEKKNSSIELAMRLKHDMDWNEGVWEKFELEKKRDDMSDALLIGAAWIQWRNSGVREGKEIKIPG